MNDCCRAPLFPRLPIVGLVVWTLFGFANFDAATAQQPAERVSFERQVRPILQANCYACHQGAKKSGDYNMTRFSELLAGGESGLAAVSPKDIDESYLIEMISRADGDPQMPPDSALSHDDILTITTWIREGAVDDSSPRPVFDQDHPPQYTRRPLVTSLAYSPSGELLAVGGLSEVLVLQASDRSLAARLIGMSPRIEKIRFSPDGRFLAVAGGSPGEFGEVQVWAVASGEQVLSKVVSHDTIYGVSWSPDGKMIAFGGTDNIVRAIDSTSGEQLVFQNAHEDWIRDTQFSVDGSHLVSVGRDMTCKLTEVAEQRFVDNITSITPGVLKGGIASVARHPQRDEIVIGGSDGVAKVYRMFRQTKRVIGDDANLVRRMPQMPGRIQAVGVSADGRRIAAASGLDGKGTLHVYSYEFDPALPDSIKAIMSKVVTARTAEEKAALDEYVTKDVRLLASATLPSSAFALGFHPAGDRLVVSGGDGMLREIASDSGQVLTEFSPFEIDTEEQSALARTVVSRFADTAKPGDSQESFEGPPIETLLAEPSQIVLPRKTSYAQVVVSARSPDGAMTDVTRLAKASFDDSMIAVSADGLVQPISPGTTEIVFSMDGRDVRIPVTVALSEAKSDFVQDVAPVLSRLGCNAGTCHGSASGKNGFQLSLRGYDPLFDVRALTDDLGSRRVSTVSPSQSLMLLKPTASVPHQGGQVLTPDHKYYWIVHNWIAGGAQLRENATKVTSLELRPANPVLPLAGRQQQMRAVATFEDGSQRDVTREAFIESADSEVAEAGSYGRITALRRGESAIIARYEGAFAATTLTVMGPREGFAWQPPESFNQIDDLVAAKWERMKITPSRLTSDTEFLRRVYLDLSGLPPTADDVRAFQADPTPTRQKRNLIIDRLIESEAFVEHWTNKWADLLQVNPKYLGAEGSSKFRQWIRQQVSANVPYDQFVRDVMTSQGSNRENPAASFFKIHRSPDLIMESTTHLFLATRFNCNKCHDHPFERWTQDQYYETAAFFARVDLKRDPASGDKNIGGTAVESATPLYEIVSESVDGEVKHERTGNVTEPDFPFDCDFEAPPDASRREKFAAWLTSPDNPYFARSYVNRLWGYLLGRGLIEPIDDIRAGNPPSNPELLRFLEQQFIESGFDARALIRLIAQSRTYQLALETNRFNADDTTNYSHAIARRLPAEVLFDAIHVALGSQTKIPGYQPGTRAAALPNAGTTLPSGFLATLGRPPRESVCECDRANDLQLGSVLALVSGPDVAQAIRDPQNAIGQLVEQHADDRDLVGELFMRILNRPPTETEMQVAIESFSTLGTDHQVLSKAHLERLNQVAAERPQLEQARLEAISEAQQDLAAFIAQTDPELPEREAAQTLRIEEIEQQIKAFNGALDDKFQQWRLRELNHVQWQPIVADRIQASSGAVFEFLPDRSVRVKETKGQAAYEFEFGTNITAVSAIRLEVLADEQLGGQGPGTAPNGNFVLSELELEISPASAPEEWSSVKLETALADFQQADYPIARAIDGKTGGGNGQGWAIVPQTGKTHWATFQLSTPVGFAGGTRFRIRMHQNYDPTHQIGRFRISIARTDRPVGLSVSEERLAKLAQPTSELSKSDRQQLDRLFYASDIDWTRLQGELTKARKPLMIDSGIVARREKLQRVSLPLPDDGVLKRLESDLAESTRQMKNQRLTAAEDLVWALINNPAFLFNH